MEETEASRMAAFISDSLAQSLEGLLFNDEDRRERIANKIADCLERIALHEPATTTPTFRTTLTDGKLVVTLEGLTPTMRQRLVGAGLLPPEHIRLPSTSGWSSAPCE